MRSDQARLLSNRWASDDMGSHHTGSPIEQTCAAGFKARQLPTIHSEVSMRYLMAALAAVVTFPAAAQITLYGRESFDGRSITFNEGERNLSRENFNDRASSAIVRGGRYEVCEDEGFRGRCVVLRPGQYPSLAAMGMGNRVSSVRPVARDYQVEDQRYAPPPPVAYDYRRREDERIFEADVVAVRAVYGEGRQRCWVER